MKYILTSRLHTHLKGPEPEEVKSAKGDWADPIGYENGFYDIVGGAKVRSDLHRVV